MYRAYNAGKNYELEVMSDLLRQAYRQESYQSFKKKQLKTPSFSQGDSENNRLKTAIIL